MSGENRAAVFKFLTGTVRLHYTGMIAGLIKRAWPAQWGTIDQHQQNAMYGVHQMRVRLPDDPVVYRMILAPADAPIFVGKIPADSHFLESIDA
jgi:exoribonuclease R